MYLPHELNDREKMNEKSGVAVGLLWPSVRPVATRRA